MPVKTVNLFGTGTEAPVDQAQILRAQQLAQMLQQQSMQPIEMPAPNAPMSWTQGLSKLAEGLASRRQNARVTSMEQAAAQKKQALINSLFPQQQTAATPQGQGLAPGAGVMSNSSTPGTQLPGLPSVTGDRRTDMIMMGGQNGPEAYAAALAQRNSKSQDMQNAFHVIPKDSALAQGSNIVATGPTRPEPPRDPLAQLYADKDKMSPEDFNARRVLLTTRVESQASKNAQGFEDPKIRSLLGAFGAAGVPVPGGGGYQSSAKLSMLQGLSERNPDAAPDEIVNGVRTGLLDLNGAKRTVAQMSTIAGLSDAASRQLEKNFASMDPYVEKMGVTGSRTIDSALAQLRQNWKTGGDKDTAAFIGYLRAVAGEYAKLKSGSFGIAGAGEGEMKDALDVMSNAFTSGGYAGLKEALTTEAENKRVSYQEGLARAAQRGTSVGNYAPPATPPTPATPTTRTTPTPAAQIVDWHRMQ